MPDCRWRGGKLDAPQIRRRKAVAQPAGAEHRVIARSPGLYSRARTGGAAMLHPATQLRPALHAMLDEVREAVLAGSAEAEALGTLPLATVEALERAGFLRLKLPAVLGGLEADPLSYMELMEALSYIDASAAWTAMTGATGSAVIGAFLPDESVAEIFAGGRIPRVAAVAMPAGRAERVDGGHRLSGRWRFASGIRHAAWVGACALVASADGVGQSVRLFVVPREAVLVHDNWQVLGLRGTGSCDFSIADLFVPASFSYAYHLDPPRRGGALYRIRGPGQTANEHAAVALGTARRALEEIGALADSKTRGMQTQVRLGSRATFQRMIGESSLRLRAAQLLMVDAWERVWAAALAGEEITPAMHAELRASATLTTDVSLAVTTAAFRSLGGDALYDSSVLQRCLRDLDAAAQHFAVSDVAYEDHGRFMLGEPGGGV